MKPTALLFLGLVASLPGTLATPILSQNGSAKTGRPSTTHSELKMAHFHEHIQLHGTPTDATSLFHIPDFIEDSLKKHGRPNTTKYVLDDISGFLDKLNPSAKPSATPSPNPSPIPHAPLRWELSPHEKMCHNKAALRIMRTNCEKWYAKVLKDPSLRDRKRNRKPQSVRDAGCASKHWDEMSSCNEYAAKTWKNFNYDNDGIDKREGFQPGYAREQEDRMKPGPEKDKVKKAREEKEKGWIQDAKDWREKTGRFKVEGKSEVKDKEKPPERHGDNALETRGDQPCKLSDITDAAMLHDQRLKFGSEGNVPPPSTLQKRGRKRDIDCLLSHLIHRQEHLCEDYEIFMRKHPQYDPGPENELPGGKWTPERAQLDHIQYKDGGVETEFPKGYPLPPRSKLKKPPKGGWEEPPEDGFSHSQRCWDGCYIGGSPLKKKKE
ncbi:hypothetical protein BU16DRAFT_584064 [Lophium mytilinum]|uniref:Uncharacterized protein n=1 Tax=Lophium mytilinum TaxID=390894 RepID=A0A6A6QL52_9PEZI|nr:hypothetical protein BU16DRAFT_584064 [Lophium mytilinum]